MFKRARWFTMGALSSLGASLYLKRLARRTRPGEVARRAGGRVTDAVREGRRAMQAKQSELEGRAGRSRPVPSGTGPGHPVGAGAPNVIDLRGIEVRDVVELVPPVQLRRAIRPGARAVSMRRATRSPR